MPSVVRFFCIDDIWDKTARTYIELHSFTKHYITQIVPSNKWATVNNWVESI